MTNYTPSRIDRIIARSRRYRKRCFIEDDFDDELKAIFDDDTPHNDAYEIRPDEAGDGHIIRKRLEEQ
jgi:hypothetical protein